MAKRLLVFLLLVVSYLLLPNSVHAADFRSDYYVTYDLSQNQNDLRAHVNFQIKITNLRSDIYVSKFSISFPKNFLIHNLSATDDTGPIIPTVTTEDSDTKIDLEFRKPNTGRDSVNNFYLNFDQDNLFQVNGNIWEVILPTIENKDDGNYRVIVNLPAGSNRKISIAKPVPDSVTELPAGRQIIWNNPLTKTIYAVFGDDQIYQTELTYHISNPKLIPVMTEIALPPDTLYQKIYLQSISETPESVYRDEDGNFMARYYLNPRESKTIDLQLFIKTLPKARPEVAAYIRREIANEKKYLLSPQPYWQISDNNLSRISSLKSARDIYNFVTGDLKYNYSRFNQIDNIRLGADGALNHPDQAVCVEFTDLFIAAAREKGIMSREIEGYGFTQDPQLRPLSLSSDILHSWPEYYNPKSKLWIPVDPTWQNTSGIDYFSSFDLNHIVFAIHGKRPDYPLPAGMYKFENSHDILVKPTTIMPPEKQKLTLADPHFPATIADNQSYQTKLIIKNDGNTYAWNIPIAINAANIKLNKYLITIPVLAPYEQTEIPLQYKAVDKNKQENGQIMITVNGNSLLSAPVTIIPYYYDLSLKIASVILVLAVVIIVFRFVRNSRKMV